MDKEQLNKVVEELYRSPAICEMKNYHMGTDLQLVREVVKKYSEQGTLYEIREFTTDSNVLISHVREAKGKNFTIDVTDTCVTIWKVLKDGGKVVATYNPLTE